MKPVYITDFKRTAFTRANPKKPELDAFADTPADTLLAQLINHSLDSGNLEPQDVDDLAIGCALGVGEQWSFGGRYPLLESRLGDQCATRMIDQQCGSGLSAIRSAALNIAAGANDIAFAAGYENMTRLPMGPTLFKQGLLGVPALPDDTGKHYDMAVVLNMGLTAENLAQHGTISRRDMDAFALRSHALAANAQQQGLLTDEIVNITLANGVCINQDANIRADTHLDALAALKPVFTENGQITAGNSSPLTSGAAITTLMSESALKVHQQTPLARIVGCVDRGVKPEMMGQGVVPAVERLLAQHGLTASDIDLWEINEAFSVVPLFAIQMLGLDINRVNVNGGALALGHPLGATGIRLVGTLARNLERSEKRYGIAAACIGGGQGIAMLIERPAQMF